MRYIQGEDREQYTLFPETMDDYIAENNPIRFIDAFVNSLDLQTLGFKYSITKETGRKPYNPQDLLKLYIYGYLNRIRSSRQLEKATHKNIELIWLLQKLQPDFKTIADFRKDNTKAIKKVCREFTLLCKKLDLFGCELIAIDGSKFSASNSNKRNYTKNKLTKLIQKVDKQINEYLIELEHGDQKESSVIEPTAEELEQKIEKLKERKDKYQRYQSEIEQSDQPQISLTDPDSRMMKTQQGRDVAYNVQITTDSKHKLIVHFDVTNECEDQNQLAPMAVSAKEILGVDSLTAIADTGYWSRKSIKVCSDQNIECYMPRPQKSHDNQQGLFSVKEFNYDSKNDCYWCPAGEKLKYKNTRNKSGVLEKYYYTLSCKTCPMKSKCTTNKWVRRIYRWEHEELAEEIENRLRENPQIMEKRKAFVEHPFGTLKRAMGHCYFLTRGIKNVTTEMSLSILSYNLMRILNIMNFKELMAAVQ